MPMTKPDFDQPAVSLTSLPCVNAGEERLFRRPPSARFGLAMTAAVLCAAALTASTGRGALDPGARIFREELASHNLGAPPQGLPPQAPPMQLLELSEDRARRLNWGRAFSSAPNPAAVPFIFKGDAAAEGRAVDCLASAGYYEAGGDLEGQRAVMQVVLNRARHPAFPSSVCGVVYQGSERKTGCQFTFTCDGALARRPVPWLWDKARDIAREALRGSVYAKVGWSTHYHTDWVLPVWSASLDKVTSLRTHLFFRWSGNWGRPPAFRSSTLIPEPVEPKLAGLSAFHRGATASEDPALALAYAADLATNDSGPTPATLLSGIDLRGSKLRLVHPQGDAFGFLLPNSFPGSFGLLALDVCRGRTFCKVMGWTDPASIPNGFPISFEARRTMAFLYVHDSSRRGEILAWNCAIFPRKDPSECLDAQVTQWDAVQGRAGA